MLHRFLVLQRTLVCGWILLSCCFCCLFFFKKAAVACAVSGLVVGARCSTLMLSCCLAIWHTAEHSCFGSLLVVAISACAFTVLLPVALATLKWGAPAGLPLLWSSVCACACTLLEPTCSCPFLCLVCMWLGFTAPRMALGDACHCMHMACGFGPAFMEYSIAQLQLCAVVSVYTLTLVRTQMYEVISYAASTVTSCQSK